MLAFSSAHAGPNGAVMYSSIPNKLPGNVASVGFEAYSATELGDGIKFVTGTGGMVKSVTIVMSSWGCESGGWNTNDCVTKKRQSFSLPITLNLYDFGATTAGALLATQTQEFDIPYRPSASPKCTGAAAGKWYSAPEKTCFNGLATEITFEFPGPGVAVPNTIIWGLTYNTTHHGPTPIGESAPCFTQSGGCGYDSLNIGTETLTPVVGTDMDPQGIYWNTIPAFYCDGGLGGALRLDSAPNPCGWQDYRPLIEFTSPGPDACKKNGWMQFTNPTFANQGACVSFYQHL